jgi:hypothetical protein
LRQRSRRKLLLLGVALGQLDCFLGDNKYFGSDTAGGEGGNCVQSGLSQRLGDHGHGLVVAVSRAEEAKELGKAQGGALECEKLLLCRPSVVSHGHRSARSRKTVRLPMALFTSSSSCLERSA